MIAMYDLRELVSVGRSAKVSRVVKESDATGYSDVLNSLMATSAVIGLAMQAAGEAIDPFLPEGYISIARQVEFEHSASTMIGIKVTVEATVTEVQQLYIDLAIKVTDELGEVGHGLIRKSIVHTASLLSRAQNRRERMLNSRR